MKRPKVQIDTKAQAEATKAQTAAVQEQTRAQTAQAQASEAAARAREVAAENAAALTRNMTQNMGSDLKNDNVAQVIAGGSADAAEGIQSTMRKRRPGGALSSQLGVNV